MRPDIEHAVEIPVDEESEQMLWDLLLENLVNYTTGHGDNPRYVFLRDGTYQHHSGRMYLTLEEALDLMAACGWSVVRIPYTDEQRTSGRIKR